MYKQVIIVRKDLQMSHGKLAAQVSHASMAFLANMIRKNTKETRKTLLFVNDRNGERIKYDDPEVQKLAKEATDNGVNVFTVPDGATVYEIQPFLIENGIYTEWIEDAFTKVVLQAKNKNALLRAAKMADELGMKEGTDYFLIRDNCRTELNPEDEDGRTLTCIGFKPMDEKIIDKIGKRYHLLV